MRRGMEGGGWYEFKADSIHTGKRNECAMKTPRAVNLDIIR